MPEITTELRTFLMEQKRGIEAERDAYLMQVNNAIGQYQGRIAQIDALLQTSETPVVAESATTDAAPTVKA